MTFALSHRAQAAQPGRLPLEVFQWAYVALALWFITGAFGQILSALTPSAGAYEDRQAGTPALQAVSLALYAPALPMLLIYNNAAARTLTRAWPLTLLVLLCIVSVGWSVDPATSLRRVIAMTLMFGVAIYCAISFTQRRLLTIIAATSAVIIVVSLLSIAVPQVGLERIGPYAGHVRGVFNEKNAFGRFDGLALLLITAFLIARPRVQWVKFALWGTLALGLALLYASNARTPLIAYIASVGVMFATKFLLSPERWQRRIKGDIRAMLVSGAALLVLVVLPLLAVAILTLLGRDFTLTGRLGLWEYATNIGWQRPWFGAGFKAFWTDALTFDLRSLHEYWFIEGAQSRNLTANAHNGYLDVWLELGFAGLALFLAFLVDFIRKAVRLIRTSQDRLSLWYIGLITFMLVYYLTNSEVLDHSDIGWFSLTAAYLSMAAREAFPPQRMLASPGAPIRHRRART